MADQPRAADASSEEKNINDVQATNERELRAADGSSINNAEDILGLQDMDPALNMKMHLVNNVRQTLLSCAALGPALSSSLFSRFL
jgi:hypothetical protein